MSRRIYLASSWRNPHQPRIVELLRAAGHEVYDFRNPSTGGPPTTVEAGFSWREIDPDWVYWTPEQYVAAMSHPAAVRGFLADKAGMDWADTCVVLQPCGPSAALEAGWSAGSGRDVITHVAGMREADLMYKLGRCFTLTDERLLEELKGPAPIPTEHQLNAARERAHDLANRCAIAEGLLGEVVEWRARHVPSASDVDAGHTAALDEVLEAWKGAKVDHPGRDAGGVAVDGGGARVGRPAPSAPNPAELRDLVREAADLATHLIDLGKCPDCHGGECDYCNGMGIVEAADDETCLKCGGNGQAPHAVDCGLASFKERARKALEAR